MKGSGFPPDARILDVVWQSTLEVPRTVAGIPPAGSSSSRRQYDVEGLGQPPSTPWRRLRGDESRGEGTARPLAGRRVAWQTTGRIRTAALGLAAVVAAGCSGTAGPILANPPAPRPSIPPPTAAPSRPADPLPVVLPRDDGPHDRLTEWWYYTGHLSADGPDGAHHFGFEFVIFRAERGTLPTTWISHLAITDETAGDFHDAQRLEVGKGVDRSPRDASGTPSGFALSLTGADPTDPNADERPPWEMRGSDGSDQLIAAIEEPEAASHQSPPLGLNLSLTSRKPPALHDRDGWIDFGPAGGSYYYSRTSMAASGQLSLAGTTFRVKGDAWFDHQWGDFISIGAGGWDWFAINLDDGTDLTLSLVRDTDGSYPIVYGTLVDKAGVTHHLESADFGVSTSDRWRSPTSGADYPAAWSIEVPREDLTIDLRPTVAAQELDTRATSGVVYWEGSQIVMARRGGIALGGAAYVELTGYATSGLGTGAP